MKLINFTDYIELNENIFNWNKKDTERVQKTLNRTTFLSLVTLLIGGVGIWQIAKTKIAPNVSKQSAKILFGTSWTLGSILQAMTIGLYTTAIVSIFTLISKLFDTEESIKKKIAFCDDPELKQEYEEQLLKIQNKKAEAIEKYKAEYAKAEEKFGKLSKEEQDKYYMKAEKIYKNQ